MATIEQQRPDDNTANSNERLSGHLQELLLTVVPKTSPDTIAASSSNLTQQKLPPLQRIFRTFRKQRGESKKPLQVSRSVETQGHNVANTEESQETNSTEVSPVILDGNVSKRRRDSMGRY